MADVFISYSRRDGEFARELNAFLKANGRDVWVDWEDIPPASQWEQDIEESIAAAESVVFVVSGSSLASEYCLLELSHAQKCGKRIVPLACDGADPGAAPEGLRQLNWIWCRESDDRDDAFAKLTRALDTDLEWAKAHTRLLVRAVEWEARQDGSLLLRGRDLEEAARQLEANAAKEPVPTELQQRYLHASRRAAAKRQRIVLGGVLLALVVSIALAVLALLQRNDARRATRAATSVALASAANDRVATKPDQALQLALAAYDSSPSAQARHAAVTALQRKRYWGVGAVLDGDAEVRSIDFSPDGRTLVVGGADGAVRLWDVRTGKEVAELRGPGSPQVVSVDFARKGRTVAAGSANGVIRLWDVESRRPIGRVLGTNRPILATAISENGQTVAAVNAGGRIWLWDAPGADPLRLTGPKGGHATLALSPDGKTLAAGATDLANVFEATPGAVRLWKSGRPLGELPSSDSVMALAFLPDGDTLAVGGYRSGGRSGTPADSYGEVQFWDVGLLQTIRTVRSRSFVRSISLSPDGETVAVGGTDGSIQLAAPREEKWIGSALQALPGEVTSLAFSPDGYTVAAAGAGATRVRVWVRESFGRTIRRGNVWGLAVSPDGRTVAAAEGEDGVLLIRTGATAGGPTRLVPDSGPSANVAFSGDANVLAVSTYDGAIHLWDLRRSRLTTRLHPRGATGPQQLALDHAGEILASVNFGVLRLWDAPRGKLIRQWPRGRIIVAAAFVDDDRTLVAVGADGSVEEWDVARAESRGPLLRPTEQASEAAVSADGRVVAFTDRTGVVRLWDRGSAERAAALPGNSEALPHVALTRDGRTLAVTRDEVGGDVQLWDVRARTPLGTPLPRTSFAKIGFAADGSVAVTAAGAAAGGELRLWEGILWRDLAHLRGQVCGLVNSDLTRAEWTAIAPGLAYRSPCKR